MSLIFQPARKGRERKEWSGWKCSQKVALDSRAALGQEQTRKRPQVCGVFESRDGDRGSREVVQCGLQRASLEDGVSRVRGI